MLEPLSNSLALLSGDMGQGGHAASFLEALPDPMKLNLWETGFIVVLLALLHVFLKAMFFRPLIQLIDKREAHIAAGEARKAEVAAAVEAQQAAYAAQLKVLRAQAFERRKALAEAAAEERRTLVASARAQASTQRREALALLEAQRASAKAQLLDQVDALSDAMAQQLLKEA